MQTKSSLRTTDFPHLLADPALKSMTAAEFAALGADRIVFLHSVTGADLNAYFPDAITAPEEEHFHLLMSAGGAPVMVADSDEAIADWLEHHEATLVQRH